MSNDSQGAPATVVISQQVRPGRREDFRAWQEGMNRTVAQFVGYLGTEVVRRPTTRRSGP